MYKMKPPHPKIPEDKEPLPDIVGEWLGGDRELAYMREHGWDALTEEYEEQFGEPYPSLREYGGGVEEYMAKLRAVFAGEDIDAIIKKHPKPEPMSIEEILELLKEHK